MAFSTVWTARSTPAQYPRGLARSTRRRDCSAAALTMRCYVGRVSGSGPPGTVEANPEIVTGGIPMTPAEDSSSRSRGPPDPALRLVPREATRLPLFALSAGLQVWEHTRGLREMMLRHGGEALQVGAHTP